MEKDKKETLKKLKQLKKLIEQENWQKKLYYFENLNDKEPYKYLTIKVSQSDIEVLDKFIEYIKGENNE